MIKEPEINMLPEGFVCPCCEAQFEWQAKVTGNKDQAPHKGMIIVCSQCAAILELGDSVLHKMTKRRLKALSATDKSILRVTVGGVLFAKMKREQKQEGN